jgi:hypothetical protein
MDVIAEQRLLVVFPDGETKPVILRIGRPFPHPKMDHVCPVQAEGLRLWQGPTEFVGVGTWHALMLAIRFLREMLTAEVERGAVFHSEGGEYAISIDELFVLHPIE